MSTAEATYEEIEEAILHWPLPERSRLVTRLIDSLEDDGSDISPAWQKEIDRRAAEIDEGNAKLVSREELWKTVNNRFETDF